MRLLCYLREIDYTEVYSLLCVFLKRLRLQKLYLKYSNIFHSLLKNKGEDSKSDKLRLIINKALKETYQEESSKQTFDSSEQQFKIKCPKTDCGAEIFIWQNHCHHCNTVFPVCMITGEVLLTKDYKRCLICKSVISNRNKEIQLIKNCPLCHQ